MRSLFLSLLLSAVFVLPAGAAVDTSKLQLPGDITLEQARTVVEGALEFAKKQGVPMNITVVDAGGNLKAFYRMDGAFLGSIDISQKKAVTARRFNMSSAELGALAQPGKELFGIEATNGGLAIFGGGELLRDRNGVIIGAIGVSGVQFRKTPTSRRPAQQRLESNTLYLSHGRPGTKSGRPFLSLPGRIL